MQGSDASRPAKLLIADDHDLVREGTRAMLEREPDIEVIGEAENGREALELCSGSCPDLVLMDIRMPAMDGLEATRRVKQACPETSVLIMTSHENPDYLLEAVRVGAAGYILKESTKRELLSVVRNVLAGESVLDHNLAMRLIKHLSGEADRQAQKPVPPPEALAESLTSRELEVLRLLALGKTNRELADELVISLSTVKRHVERIISKLKVSDRTQAAVKAVELGLHAG